MPHMEVLLEEGETGWEAGAGASLEPQQPVDGDVDGLAVATTTSTAAEQCK